MHHVRSKDFKNVERLVQAISDEGDAIRSLGTKLQGLEVNMFQKYKDKMIESTEVKWNSSLASNHNTRILPSVLCTNDVYDLSVENEGKNPLLNFVDFCKREIGCMKTVESSLVVSNSNFYKGISTQSESENSRGNRKQKH